MSAPIDRNRGIDKSETEHGLAWVILSLALAIHVADEALGDFLSFWNPLVRAIRERIPVLPLPTFVFEVWLAGLILGVLVLLALSRYAFHGARWMVPLSYALGVMMFGNGLFHILGSIYIGEMIPGVYSAPVLLAASIYLVRCAYRRADAL